jgi:F-type H+-transporting ATPase subunit epsilon
MAKHLQLDIVTPEKITFSENVDSVSLPAAQGEMGVLPDHMPYVTELKAGELRYTKDGKSELLAISGGFAELHGNKVVVLAETAELAAEIDLKRVEMKVDEKAKALKDHKLNPVEMDTLRANMLKELVRMKVAEKMRKRA